MRTECINAIKILRVVASQHTLQTISNRQWILLCCTSIPGLVPSEAPSNLKLVKTDKLFSRKPNLLQCCLLLWCFFAFLEENTKETINSQCVPSKRAGTKKLMGNSSVNKFCQGCVLRISFCEFIKEACSCSQYFS